MKCIIVDDNILALKTAEQFVSKVDYLELSGTFSDPVSALSFVSENKIDLIFLDVEMPEMNGIEFIKALKQPHPMIILTTTHKDYAPEAYENEVTDYLVKPLNHSRFMNSVAKAYQLFQAQMNESVKESSAFVKKGNSIVKVDKSEVLWIESLGDYVALNTSKDKFIVHSTMQEIMDKFPSNEFIRVHRSFIVRIKEIESIEDDVIKSHHKEIPIGKTYKQEVYKKLNLL